MEEKEWNNKFTQETWINLLIRISRNNKHNLIIASIDAKRRHVSVIFLSASLTDTSQLQWHFICSFILFIYGMSEIMEITLHRLSKENTNSREKFIFVRFTIVISSYVEYRFCWDEGKIFSHRTESLEFHHKLLPIDYRIHNKFVKSYFHIYFYHIFNHQSIPIYFIVKYCHRNMMI